MYVLNVRLLRHSKAPMKKTKVSHPLDFGKAPGAHRQHSRQESCAGTFMQARPAIRHRPDEPTAPLGRSRQPTLQIAVHGHFHQR
jgi:hypothetical protein